MSGPKVNSPPVLSSSFCKDTFFKRTVNSGIWHIYVRCRRSDLFGSFAESYIAEEGHWAFVDVSSRKAYVMDGQGHLLNAVELFEAIQNNREEGLRVALYQGGQIVEADYTQHALPEHYYFQEGHKLSFPRAPHLYGPSVRRLGYQLLSPRRTLLLEEQTQIVFEGLEVGPELAVE